jgi:hypothetical protein
VLVLARRGCRCGQGATAVLRIDPATGTEEATIPLPQRSHSLAVVGDHVEVGLDNARVAVIDPATNRVARIVTIATPGHPAAGAIVGITPVAGGDASWVTRTDGLAFELIDGRRVDGPATFLTQFNTSGAAVDSDVLWAAATDKVVASTTDDSARGYAIYDPSTHTFGPLISQRRRLVPSFADSGIDTVVAAGRTLWFAGLSGPVLVVAPS